MKWKVEEKDVDLHFTFVKSHFFLPSQKRGQIEIFLKKCNVF